jgi:UV DNA damage endonuclease
MKIGYCCINLSLNEGKKSKDKILVNRGMTKKTFETKGLDYVSELIIKNLNDLEKILNWNIKNDIYIYRMSSDMFPWMTSYEFNDLPNYKSILKKLISLGDFIKANKIRTSFHPGPFNVLSSENPLVVEKTVKELNKHSEIMDLMGLPMTTMYSINIHIGSTKPSRIEAAEKFVNNFNLLSESCKKRLTVENDDSLNKFSVKMLYDLVYKKIKIPIVFDQLHFYNGTQDQSIEEALKLALSTWETRPITHMSSSKILESEQSRKTAHADYIYEKIENFDLDFDVEIEAKLKDLAVLKYKKDFNIS